MNIYSIDVQIVGTAYIKAESEEEALKIANSLPNEFLEFSNGHQCIGDDICMDGGSYQGLADNDEPVALSPAMTITGVFNGEGIELVEELEDA